MQFRKDINGLRAIAVIAVVLFHFNASWLPGGFAGVDVFFVISGFLMTGIIFKGLEKENFSCLKFYMSRANRIIPALLFTITFFYVICFFIYSPNEYREMSIYSIVSLVFLSNVYYWKNTDYFNPDVENNIFVHTWSLSAEWQFYIIYPLVVISVLKFINKKDFGKVILLLCFVFFIINVWCSVKDPNGSYYLLVSRVWEMLVGAFAFFLKGEILYKKSVSYISLLILVVSLFFISENDYWPGYMALLPVLSTFLIILANSENIVLNNPFIKYIGSRSYSIYLWHWPIYVLLSRLNSPNITIITVGIITSIICAEFSYRKIETYRSSFKLIVTVMFMLSISFTFYKLNGKNFASLINPIATDYLLEYTDYRDKHSDKYGVVSNSISKSRYDSVFLWGDSHAEALVFGFNEYFSKNEVPFNYSSSGNCMAGIGIGLNVKKEDSPDYLNCLKSNNYSLAYIKRIRPKVVIFAQRDEHQLNDFKSIINNVNDSSIEYVVIGPVPQWKGGTPLKIAYEYLERKTIYMNNVVPHLFKVDNDAKVKYLNGNINYISILDYICDTRKQCIGIVDEKKSSLHWDNSHLSLEGASYLVGNYLGVEVLSLLKNDKQN